MLLALIPGFPLPGTVTGMVFMLILLLSGAVKLNKIKHAAGFFLTFLPMFFVPLIVNLLKEGNLLREYGIKLLIVIMTSTVITMLAAGLTAKLMLNLNKKRKSGR